MIKGIPYAKPPRRFEDFAVIDSIHGEIFVSPSCFQQLPAWDSWMEANIMFKDCLTLDIYRPVVTDPNNEPGIIFDTHGGGLYL